MDFDHNERPNSTLYQQLMALQPLYPTASLRELISFADDLFPYASEDDLISLEEEGLMGQDDGYSTGNLMISSGLREDNIIQQLKIRRRSRRQEEVADDDEGFEEICVVCQGEYEDEEMLGALGYWTRVFRRLGGGLSPHQPPLKSVAGHHPSPCSIFVYVYSKN
ncbi:unnamed protein product [Coffea canephora]|uniref:Uncharacterized protein n=1 Tax=Coffea canephora TaxID=49390 RepID=A0A068UM95_COFCA|nr:unnamed protein product [Coffea canephora]CDP14961.1 unnamed protein product [Coffea canephora]